MDINNISNVIYILIWASSAGFINSIITLITKKTELQAFIYAIIFTISILLYKYITNKELILRSIKPQQ